MYAIAPYVPDSASVASTRSASTSGRLPEIHGLRGLALVLVVVFHLFGHGRVSGGVDVFLVVSGFLVTRSLVRRADGGRLRLSSVYARNAGRLAPAALLVLAAVAGATWLILPESQWLDVWRQTVASALYLENWELIANHLTYGAAGPDTSPLQHFWSLSVQGQFLLVWPMVIFLISRLLRRSGTSARLVMVPLTVVLTVASFWYAVVLTAEAQPVAYFHAASRLWELTTGALLGLVPLGVPRRLRALGAWLGLGLVVASGFALDGGVLFPGPWTLWPVIGAILVILGAGTQSSWGPRVMLESRPLRFLADISYELYLWHWPVLIFLMAILDITEVGWREAAIVLGCSVLLAWSTRAAVSVPVSRVIAPGLPAGRSMLALGAATMATLLVAVPVVGAHASVTRDREQASQVFGQTDDLHLGAAAFGVVERVPDAPVRPRLDVSREDMGEFFTDDRCVNRIQDGKGADELRWCELNSPAQPRFTVMLAGASHTYQWADTFLAIARENNWRLVVAGKGRCRVRFDEAKDTPCYRWGRSVIDLATELRPDAVVVAGTHTHYEGELETVPADQVAAWSEIATAGIRVIGLRDNPRPGGSASATECLAVNGPESGACDLRYSQFYQEQPVGWESTGAPASMVHVDLTPWMCRVETDRCPVVIGNVLVYRDGSHLTSTFMVSLTPMLEEALQEQASWLFEAP
ncbi:acyltransferase family protein [Myceligenerans indicum]|uniref:Acyltransferase n=1 Tax=Myceligenerans indicum TaxID=2593663 RepID=A0ABS1LIA3_9MICO|nr:acyltransferase family protein [Myceligenerans indicum]MBL0885874.1 acyltransferase [Myceligenerans indicum]